MHKLLHEHKPTGLQERARQADARRGQAPRGRDPVTTIRSAYLEGVNARPITATVTMLRRLPRVVIVGLADVAVRETAERVRSAIEVSGFTFPRQRVVVEVDPVDVRKDGAALDLPIALLILAASGQIKLPEGKLTLLAFGELGLDGHLRPVRGSLAFAEMAAECGWGVLCPTPVANLVATVDRCAYRPVADLREAVAAAQIPGDSGWHFGARRSGVEPATGIDMSEVVVGVDGANLRALRALEIAAAGRIPLHLEGPPGCGRTMLARRMTTILPRLTPEDLSEVARIQDVAGLCPPLPTGRPFRAPHYTVSLAGMFGDRTLRPGEVALAHNGVLLLDELTEFNSQVVELLRQPVEEGRYTVTRAANTTVHPARFWLVTSSPPCPCGREPCTCPAGLVEAHRRRAEKLRGFSIRARMAPVRGVGPRAPSSAEIRSRVEAASLILTAGSHASDTFVEKVARTISALDGRTSFGPDDMTEAESLVRGE